MATVQNGSRLPVANKDFTEAAVVIVGAGISGMCMAIDLLKRNQCQNFIVIEKSAGLGGTWRDSRYPGCCCDGLLMTPEVAENSANCRYSLGAFVQLFIRAKP